MHRLTRPALAAAAVIALAALALTHDQRDEATTGATTEALAHKIPMPPPTENWLDDDAEQDNKQRRKAWFKALHKAAPGVDWKAIEQQNGLAQLAKRNALSAVPWEDPYGGGWVERGSNNQAGRMMVGRHSTDGGQIYAGSHLGGVWKGSSDGAGWEAIGDNLYGGAHWLEVSPGDGEEDPDVVLAATDYGMIHYSEDDGESWLEPAGLVGDRWYIRRMLKTSDGSHTIFAAWYNATGRGFLLRSGDGGRSFETVLELGYYFSDLWTPRTGDSTLYLLLDDETWVSEDLGDSWEVVGRFPGGVNSDGAELAGSEAGGPRLWAVLYNDDTLLRSDDAGESWTSLGRVDDYWGTLTASIIDEDVFAWGGMEMHYTEDGGDRFNLVNGWSEYYGDPANLLHADMMGMDVVDDGEGGEVWYIATDGGLYHSLDTLETVQNLSLTGLRVSQYYGTLTSSVDPSQVAAGAQDQGYQVTNGIDQTRSSLDFEQIISGDYAHLVSTGGTHDFVYSVYPGFMLVQEGGDSIRLHYVDFPSGETAAWLPPLAADPDEPEAVFLCARSIYRYTRNSRGEWSPERWSSGDLGTNQYDYVTALAFSPLNPDRAYAATYYGGMYWSDDGGRSWSRSATTGTSPQYFYGHGIVASSLNEDEVLIGGSGYSNSAIWRSTDGGRTFEAFDDGIPETLVYSLGEAPDGSGAMFAGTETSVWRRDPGEAEWTDITGDDAPVTIYWSVEALAHENTMRFGTYGRGIWDYQLEPDDTPCWPVLDQDGDGVDCLTDCSDLDASTFPGAPEDCDGVDRSCDPDDLDEGDADGDGVIACFDCDDDDGARGPGFAEVCGDGIDQDCDGVDPECPPTDTTEPTEPTEPVDTDPPEVDEGAGGDPEGYPNPKGCGCATPAGQGAPGGPGSLALLLLGAVAVRRRR